MNIKESANSGLSAEAAARRSKIILFFAIITLAVTFAYSNHFNNEFHFDDGHTIQNNIYIQNIKNIPLFFKDGTTFSSLPANQSYRPVVSTTLAFDYWLGNGLNPFYFHLSTFILFIIQGFLMFFLYLKIFNISHPDRSNFFIAAFAVSWYLLHPVNTETINYIIARSDSLSTLFVLLAFVLFIYSPFSRKWYLYLVPVAIGALAKPPAVMFAPLLLIYVVCFEETIKLARPFWKSEFGQFKSALKTTLPAFLFCGYIFWIIELMEPKTWNPGGVSRFRYLITEPYVILHYFTTFFFPLSLSADTDWTEFNSFFDIRVFAGTAFILLLVSIAIVAFRNEKLRPVSFGIAWFFIALIPTSSIIPLSEVLNYHRLFFPYVGLMIGVCWSIALILMWAQRLFGAKQIFKPLVATTAVIVLVGSAYGTYQRNKVWRTEQTLWYDVTIKSPNNARGLMNYGLELMGKADYAGAEKYFYRALELAPHYHYLYINLGILKDFINQPAEAEEFFKKGIAYGSDHPNCYYYYAKFLKKQNRIAEAVKNLNKALELAPAHLYARDLLMSIYYEQSEFTKLILLASQTLKISPKDPEAVSYLDLVKNRKSNLELALENSRANKTPENFLYLSLEYYRAGEFKNCIEAANEALKLKPDYAEAYNNICTGYNGLKMWDKAIIAGEEAVRLKPDFQLAKNNLAWARSQKETQQERSRDRRQ